MAKKSLYINGINTDDLIPVPTGNGVLRRNESDTAYEWADLSPSSAEDGYIAIAALYQFVEAFVNMLSKDLPEVLDDWTNNLALSRESHDKIVEWILNKKNKELDIFLEKAKIPYGLVELAKGVLHSVCMIVRTDY